ncbi:homoprotocatechuate degradation operon regulator, HpaR [Porphyromonas macacae]|uniref:Homoprotocatechuate degradation operon regulator, HpaR n=1 Tax=Porphyromonas macacae TaxID=28115 RepID=A0A379EC30_9PORP|nr:MarR family winged helix-turn-helix transcriptional regulator [Porphyromonas macacae]SUB89922.1 homoprotocatechuate degradation operon regulator, HpaR [Porphyromonas macacae]
MKSKELIVALLDYVELFERTVQHADEFNVDGFLAFMNGIVQRKQRTVCFEDKNTEDLCDAGIAKDISMLHRYSRTYMKKALAASAYLQTEDEYTYLVTLLSENGLTKTELNNRNCMEKTSGSEIIRRLKKYGLIEEEPDMNDKRSVRVFITPKGRKELMSVFPVLRLSANALSAPLLYEQKDSLRQMLRLLCTAHGSVFPRRNELDLEKIYNVLHKQQQYRE